MAYVATKGRFHVALDSVGMLLQGAPDRPGYVMSQAPIYAQRFGEGDRSYTDFSFWWFWAQTDWAGGYKLEDRWKDDAKFFDSEGVSISVYPGETGSVRLNAKQLNTVSSVGAKDRSLFTFGDPFNTFMLLGRNNTDQKMCAINAFDGSVVWEDTAVGANEKVLAADNINDDLFIGCRTVGSGASMLKKGTGGAFTDVGAHASGIAISGLVAYPTLNSLFLLKWGDGLWQYDHTAGTFTQKKTTLPMNLTSASSFSFGSEGFSKFGAVLVGDRIYFTYKEANVHQAQLWAYDIGDNAYVHVYTFKAGTFTGFPYLIERDGNLCILGSTGGLVYGKILIYKLDSVGNLTQIHKIGRADDAQFSLFGGVVKNSESIYFGLNDNSSDFQIWQLDRSDALYSGIKPPAAYATDIDLIAMSNVGNLAVHKTGTGTIIDEFDSIPINDFQTSGFLITSKFDADIPSIDKLFYAVTISFKKFLSGQSIAVDYSIDGGATFTALGTASFTIDGGTVTSKTFFFGTTVLSKNMKLKFTLAGGGSNTPALEAYAVQYVPIPIYTKQWVLQINCGDEVKDLAGALIETTGRELKSRLEVAWWTKALLDFQDLDYATTLLNGALTNSATTITVDDTKDFPEQGRLRLDDEEIFYTGKTPTTFTGCTRGVRGTVAVSHLDNAVINNAYRVLVTDFQARAPILLQDKRLEYVAQVTLREG